VLFPLSYPRAVAEAGIEPAWLRLMRPVRESQHPLRNDDRGVPGRSRTFIGQLRKLVLLL
jgi:hypothetical protein